MRSCSAGVSRDPYYEYGYAYVGYLVVGFCKWLNRLSAQSAGASTDSYLRRGTWMSSTGVSAYSLSVDAVYVKASRTSSIHLSFERHIDHFFDWHIRRRISSVPTLGEVLQELELNDPHPVSGGNWPA
ncbi:MAG: hypothetical protein V8T10_09565 [Merdibacter sp.]